MVQDVGYLDINDWAIDLVAQAELPLMNSKITEGPCAR